ncbi:MAG TPA: iron-sulfur cluster assembly protein, partial [Candidatus Tectomicrobia bacterium]|nr:iron-sulfur cluster assembly protein [Candidatus Tectomicrobia bacterium]
MATPEQVLDALRAVRDPESDKDIVSLGLVRDLAVGGGEVTFTLAFAGQPPASKASIHSAASRVVGQLPG